jgi:hypothetical protein
VERDIFDIVAKGLFALLFIHALIEFARHRDRTRLEAAALLGILATSVLIEDMTDALDANVDTSLFIALLLVSQPLLFLRLIDQFQPVPQWPVRVSLAFLVLSWITLFFSGVPPSPIATGIVVALFMLVESYAIAMLVRVTRASHGIARVRLAAILTGSALVALYILLAGITFAWPDTEDTLRPAAGPITLAVAVSRDWVAWPPMRVR